MNLQEQVLAVAAEGIRMRKQQGRVRYWLRKRDMVLRLQSNGFIAAEEGTLTHRFGPSELDAMEAFARRADA